MLLAALLLAACTRGFEQTAEVLRSGSPTAPPAPTTAPPVPPGSIRIRAPRAGDDVLSPVPVRGVAETEGGTVLVRIVDAEGAELAAMNVGIACGGGCRGRFEARLAFYVPARTAGLIQVLEVGPGGIVAQHAEVSVALVPGT